MLTLNSLFCVLRLATAHASDPVRFHFKIEYVSDLDRTAVGGEYYHGVTTMTAAVSLTTRDSAHGTVVHVAIDSVSAVPTGAAQLVMDPSAAGWVKGAYIEAFVSDGKIIGEPRESMGSAVVHLLVPAVELLFASDWGKANPGAMWSDTLSLAFAATEQSGRVGNTITTWHAAAAAGGGVALDASSATNAIGHGQLSGERGILKSSESAHIDMQGGQVRRAASRSTWTLQQVSREAPNGIPGSGSITITVDRIASRQKTPTT